MGQGVAGGKVIKPKETKCFHFAFVVKSESLGC